MLDEKGMLKTQVSGLLLSFTLKRLQNARSGPNSVDLGYFTDFHWYDSLTREEDECDAETFRLR